MEWQIMALILMAVVIALIFGGVWIAVALGITGVIGLLISDPHMVGALKMILWSNVNSYTLAAVPLFVFMSSIILHSGISMKFYDCLAKWLDRLPGSLVHANIVACTIFAALCGSSIATAAAIGRVAIPEMEKRGYDRRLTYGSLAAGGTLGILIPPSIPMIIYGIMVGQSIGRLFMAGIIPGLALAFLFSLYVLLRTIKNPSLAPRREGISSWKDKLKSTVGIVPMLALIVLVLGGIYMGLMTPTEASGIGSAGAIVIVLAYRRLNFDTMRKSLKDTLKISCMTLFILVGAQIMALAMVEAKIPRSLATFLTEQPFSPWVIFVFIALIYLLFGMFLSLMATMLLTLPIVYPVILALGFDPIWFGVIMVILLEIGQLTPPVGLNLFVIQGISQRPISEVILGSLPFVFVMLIGVVMLSVFPVLALWLPSHMIG